MTKFTTDQKLSAVMAYPEGKDSMNDIAKSLGIAPTLMRNWVKQFDYHGPMVFSKPYTTYPAQFKLDVLQYMKENGVSANEAAAIFNIASPSSVWKWERQLKTGGQGTLIPKKKGRPPMKDKTIRQVMKSVEPPQRGLQKPSRRKSTVCGWRTSI